MDEKLGGRVVLGDGTKAQRPLSSLRACRRYLILEGDATHPVRVSICPMDAVSTWTRLSGPGAMFVIDE